jgi:hypothetical protein
MIYAVHLFNNKGFSIAHVPSLRFDAEGAGEMFQVTTPI